jgi:hypothetical protein
VAFCARKGCGHLLSNGLRANRQRAGLRLRAASAGRATSPEVAPSRPQDRDRLPVPRVVPPDATPADMRMGRRFEPYLLAVLPFIFSRPARRSHAHSPS